MRQVLLYVWVMMTSFPMTPAMVMEKTGYRAAVYAHKPIVPTILPVSRQKAVQNMMANVEIYREQAQLAASQGAQIIVFPEDGLYAFLLGRRTIRPYLEPIPDPQTSRPWVPCTDPGRVTPSDILTQLSCIARNNSIYVVANMGDIKPCDDKSNDVTKTCPPDGHYQYNTDVVFDTTGQLVARYHKRTLFGESQFDTPPVERITFDTPFGRFGVFTCFDILFYDPAVVLVEQGIQNVVFPTAWMDLYPLLDAVGFHSAWARGHGVNLLSANIQLPEFRFLGSGVYSASGALDFYYDHSIFSGGRLIVVDVPGATSLPENLDTVDDELTERKFTISNASSHGELPPRRKIPDAGTWLNRRESGPSIVEHMSINSNGGGKESPFENVISDDVFEMVEVNDASGTVSVCKGKTCCTLSYSKKKSVSPESLLNQDYFAFGASEGVHDSDKDWYFEACLLVRCTDSWHSSCGDLTWDSSTLFTSVVISGNFSTKYIYPELLVSNNGQVALTPPEEWHFSKEGTLTATRLSKPLLTAALYARDYTKDPR